jgi:hypothetical protein
MQQPLPDPRDPRETTLLYAALDISLSGLNSIAVGLLTRRENPELHPEKFPRAFDQIFKQNGGDYQSTEVEAGFELLAKTSPIGGCSLIQICACYPESRVDQRRVDESDFIAGT